MFTNPSGTTLKDYQRDILPHVSRTFALTIPQLPPAVADVVTNAYLLCRIADTIEDNSALDGVEKMEVLQDLLLVLRGEGDADAFGSRLAPRLSDTASRHELDLIRNTRKVVAFTHSLKPGEQEVLTRCMTIMCRGMGEYQRNASVAGLRDLAEVDRYCYFVAGVVGEMLTELFALHSAGAREHYDEMLGLATSFGEGLQLTNILKDVWKDRRHGACWLPRSIFAEHGVDLAELQPETTGRGFAQAMDHMVGVAHGHLRNALRYTLLIPTSDIGMRRFCLWAIGMAVLTLWRIHLRPGFTSGDQVKISRRLVKAVIIGSNLTARYDRLLKALFTGITMGLPQRVEPIDPELSDWDDIPAVDYGDQVIAGGQVRRAESR